MSNPNFTLLNKLEKQQQRKLSDLQYEISSLKSELNGLKRIYNTDININNQLLGTFKNTVKKIKKQKDHYKKEHSRLSNYIEKSKEHKYVVEESDPAESEQDNELNNDNYLIPIIDFIKKYSIKTENSYYKATSYEYNPLLLIQLRSAQMQSENYTLDINSIKVSITNTINSFISSEKLDKKILSTYVAARIYMSDYYYNTTGGYQMNSIGQYCIQNFFCIVILKNNLYILETNYEVGQNFIQFKKNIYKFENKLSSFTIHNIKNINFVDPIIIVQKIPYRAISSCPTRIFDNNITPSPIDFYLETVTVDEPNQEIKNEILEKYNNFKKIQ